MTEHLIGVCLLPVVQNPLECRSFLPFGCLVHCSDLVFGLVFLSFWSRIIDLGSLCNNLFPVSLHHWLCILHPGINCLYVRQLTFSSTRTRTLFFFPRLTSHYISPSTGQALNSWLFLQQSADCLDENGSDRASLLFRL